MNVFPFPLSNQNELSPKELKEYAQYLSALPQNCPHCLKCELSYKSISKFLEDMNKEVFSEKIEYVPSNNNSFGFDEIKMFGISLDDLKAHRYA